MSYQSTARWFVSAERWLPDAPATRQRAADRLPLSEWGEARREHMTPQTIAANHALHVSGVADDLRETLDAIDSGDAVKPETLIRRARALLAAIGEGEA